MPNDISGWMIRVSSFCAEPLRRDHRETGGQTLGKTDNQKGQRASRADCSERIDADGAPDNDRIGHAVQLLKNIADQKRDGKGQNQFCGIAPREVPGH